MAEKISVEIALEGGSEIEQQLAAIGKAGQKTFSDIKDAADQLDFSSVSDEFQGMGDSGVQAFQKIQTAVKSAAIFEQVIQGVKNVEGAFESLGTAATKMAARMTRSLGLLGVAARALGPLGIALGVAGGAFVKFGDNAADGLNKLTAASAKLDLSAQNFDKLQKVLQQTGVASDTILPGLEKLKETLSKEFFQTDVITGFKNFIAQLERMPDGAERTRLAMEKLGDSLGAQVIAGLQTGTISANNLAAAFGRITPATQQQIVEAAKYQQALNQLSTAWNEFKAAVASPLIVPLQFLVGEIQKVTAGFEGLKSTYQTLKAMLSEDFSLPWLAKLVNFDPNLLLSKWLPVLQALQTTLNAVGISTPGLDALVVKAQAAAQELAKTGQAGAQAGQQTAQGLKLVADPLTGMPQVINTANQALQQTGQTGTTAFQQVGTAADQATIKTIAFKNSNLAITWDNILSAGVSAWNALTSAIQSAIDKLLVFIGLKPSAPATGNGAPGKALGGLLGGHGSGTSDSNLAWVSRGEHIMPARAVAQPGVLAFLEALRRSGGNLSAVLNGIGRFALGGMVPRPAMAFAGGGLAGGMSNVTIQFPGLPAIGGLRASSAVVDELHRAAALAQVRSGGRKPSRYS